MPEIVVSDELHAFLKGWANEQQRPVSELVHDILLAAQHTRERYDPSMSDSTRRIRWCRDGGCGLCEELVPLFATGKERALGS